MARGEDNFDRRKRRLRTKLKRLTTRPRLSVHRSDRHIYAQVIDDVQGKTLAAASSLEKDLRTNLKTGGDMAAVKAQFPWARGALVIHVEEVTAQL